MATSIFLDANILVAVLNKEYPVYSYAARIISLTDNPHYKLYTSPLCLAIAFYFASKKSGASMALEKIRLLCKKINIADCTYNDVKSTLTNKAIDDFEDGLEYYSALSKKCTYIITEDQDDFHFSKINVYSSVQFFDQVLLG
jgi:predicted nucleic acid-binding protein